MKSTRYVTYLPDGSLDGCYLQIPPEEHATCLIVIDETQAADWVLYRANDARDGLELAPPPPPAPVAAPQRVPMLNAHLVLIDAGWMDGINAYIDSLPDPDRSKARAYFNQAQTMARDNPLVQGIPVALGKTEAEVDQLFIAAAALDP